MKHLFFLFLLFVVFYFTQNVLLARPEYAAKVGIVNCSACHYSPFGGGPRQINGKYFGARQNPFGKNSMLENFSFDLKINTLYPRDAEKNTNGVAIMNAIGAAHPHLNEVPGLEGGVKSQLVADYNFGVLGAGTLRNAYVLFPLKEENDYSFFSSFMFGKFNIPFGLMTDEHRHYLRMQSKTTYNEFDTGVALSGDPSRRIHYDMILTSANTLGGGSGGFTSADAANPESRYGYGLNLRHDIQPMPWLIGASWFAQKSLVFDTPTSYSIYAIYSGYRRNTPRPFTLLFEVVRSKGWNNSSGNGTTPNNPTLATFFLPSSLSTYADTVKEAKSLGMSSELQWDFSTKYMALYRYEQLQLDQKFPGERFERHSIGVKNYFMANASIQFRVEQARSRVQGIEVGQAPATRDYYYAIFNYWL